MTRRRLVVLVGAALLWAVSRAGIGGDIVNGRGWGSFARFWRAVGDPEVDGDFLRLTVDAAGVTLSYAVLGTVLSLVVGAVGALALSELLVERPWARRLARVTLVVPRAVHEVVWALLLVQVLGFDPLVAVLAIGIPFGAVTAKVFAETIDEADPGPYHLLRSAGAGRLAALAYGIVPNARGELLSFGFYRFECAIRSAAVLGVIGVGGLGFQLDLSFETLRYGEMWTLIAALMVLSAMADGWSSLVRRSRSAWTTRTGLAALVVVVPVSWRWAGIDPTTLWSARTRHLFGDLVDDLFAPRLGPGGFGELWSASIDTLAMSMLAIAIAVVGGLGLAAVGSRPVDATKLRAPAGLLRRWLIRLALLLMRAVPAPIWAFLFVLVLFPGPWPGAVALGVYNLGVVGRLFTETIDERDPRPVRQLVAGGASPAGAFVYATLPSAAPRLISIAVYRWEVVLRETVVVGVVGAGGLGRLMLDHLTARDFAAVSSVVGALVVLSLLVDTIGAALRRSFRTESHVVRR